MAVIKEDKPPEESRNAGCTLLRRGHLTRHLRLDPERYPLHPVIEALRQTPPKLKLQVIRAVDEGEKDEEPQPVVLLEPVLSKGMGGEGGKDTADDVVRWLREEGRKISSAPPAAPAKEGTMQTPYVDESAARAPHEDTPQFEVEIDVDDAGVPLAAEEQDAGCETAEAAPENEAAESMGEAPAETAGPGGVGHDPYSEPSVERPLYPSDTGQLAWRPPEGSATQAREMSVLEVLCEIFGDPAAILEGPVEGATPGYEPEAEEPISCRSSGVGELLEDNRDLLLWDIEEDPPSGGVVKDAAEPSAPSAHAEAVAPEKVAVAKGADAAQSLPGTEYWAGPAQETVTLTLLIIDHQGIGEKKLEARENKPVFIGRDDEACGIRIIPALERHAMLTVDGQDIIVESATSASESMIFLVRASPGVELDETSIRGMMVPGITNLGPGDMVRIRSTLIAVTRIEGEGGRALMETRFDDGTVNRLHLLMKAHAPEFSGLNTGQSGSAGDPGTVHVTKHTMSEQELPWLGGPDADDGASVKTAVAGVEGVTDGTTAFTPSIPQMAPLPRREEISDGTGKRAHAPDEARVERYEYVDTGEADEEIKKMLADAAPPKVTISEEERTMGAAIVDEGTGLDMDSIDAGSLLSGAADEDGEVALELDELEELDDHTEDVVEDNSGPEAKKVSAPPPVPAKTAVLMIETEGAEHSFVQVSSDGNPVSLVALGICKNNICGDDVTLGFVKGSLVLSNNLMGAGVNVNGEKREKTSAGIRHGDVLSVNGETKAIVYFMDEMGMGTGGRAMNEGSVKVFMENRSFEGFEADKQVFWNRLRAMEGKLRSLNAHEVPEAVAIWSSKLSEELMKAGSAQPERQKRAYRSAMDCMEHIVDAACGSDSPLPFLRFISANRNTTDMVSAMVAFRSGAALEEISIDEGVVYKAVGNGMEMAGTFEQKMLALLNALPDDTLMRIKQGTLRCDLQEGSYKCGKEGIMAVMNTMLYPRGIALLEQDGRIILARASHMASDGDTDYVFVKPLNSQQELPGGDGMPLAVFDMLPIKEYAIAEGLVMERRPGSPRNPKGIVMLAGGNPEENGMAARCGAQRRIDALSGYRKHIEGKFGAGSDKCGLYLSASALAAGLYGSGMNDKDILKRLKKIGANRKSDLQTAAAMLQAVIERDSPGRGNRETLLRYLDDEYCGIGGYSVTYRMLFGHSAEAVVPDSNGGKRDSTPTSGGIVGALTGKISTILRQNNGDCS